MTKPGQQLTSWTYDGLPRVSTDEMLAVWARAYDANHSYDHDIPWAVFQVDWSRPQSTIEVPDGTVQTGALDVSGAATDERYVKNVRLVIRDIPTGKYWTGTTWVDSWTYLFLPVSRRNQRWSYRNDSLKGYFYISTRAIDDSGNVQSIPTSITLHVQ